MKDLKYWELVRISWLVVRRGTIGALLINALMLPVLTLGILGLFGTVIEVDQAFIMGLFFCYSTFVIYPLIIAVILKKQRKNYRFEIERLGATLNSDPAATS